MAKKARELDLSKTLAAIAKKDRYYYRGLTEQQKKEFSAFVYQKFVSNVSGDCMKQVCFIAFTNTNVNMNLFLLSRHPELQWMTLTTVNPTTEHCNFKFTAGGNKIKNKKQKILEAVYPDAKIDDLRLLAEINSDQEINDIAEQHHLEFK
jgi:hypothetical protein